MSYRVNDRVLIDDMGDLHAAVVVGVAAEDGTLHARSVGDVDGRPVTWKIPAEVISELISPAPESGFVPGGSK